MDYTAPANHSQPAHNHSQFNSVIFYGSHQFKFHAKIIDLLCSLHLITYIHYCYLLFVAPLPMPICLQLYNCIGLIVTSIDNVNNSIAVILQYFKFECLYFDYQMPLQTKWLNVTLFKSQVFTCFKFL